VDYEAPVGLKIDFLWNSLGPFGFDGEAYEETMTGTGVERSSYIFTKECEMSRGQSWRFFEALYRP